MKQISVAVAAICALSLGMAGWAQEAQSQSQPQPQTMETAKKALDGYNLKAQLASCEAFKQKAQEFRQKVLDGKAKIDKEKTASVQDVVNLLDNKLSMTDTSSAYNICRQDRLVTHLILRTNYQEFRIQALEKPGDKKDSDSKKSIRSRRRRR